MAASPQTRFPGLIALDHLSERLVAAAPFRFGLAETAADRHAVFALRGRQVLDGGWASADRLAGDLERDAHDDDALHVCAWDGETLAGAIRIVLPAAGRRLPVETAFDLDIEPRGAVAEAGRLVVSPEFRGDPGHRAWGGLFGSAWLGLRRHGLTVLAGAATAPMVGRLRALGLPFEVLAPARPHWGQERHPVRLDPAQGDPRWFEAPSDSAPARQG